MPVVARCPEQTDARVGEQQTVDAIDRAVSGH
jgi:hypothetical protein